MTDPGRRADGDAIRDDATDGWLTDGDSTDDDLAGTVAWNELLVETTGRLEGAGIEGAAQEARWMLQEASGMDGAEWVLGATEPATVRGVTRLDAMVQRRCGGEPIQYVLGRWEFRTLDLLCDRRALIPRPETEQVVDHALEALDQALLSRPDGHQAIAADLGTGTGAIALSIAVERPGAEAWATDRATDALAVARANLAGLGMGAKHVRVVEGSWFAALPDELRGRLDLVVTNPPYVAAHEELPTAVADWEPTEALVSGPTGLEAYEELLGQVVDWLAPGGAFVAELGATQGAAVSGLAEAAGLVDVRIEPDHIGHDRTLVAHRPA